MARKKISTTVYITPEQNEALHVLHERTKVPVAVYIREGIDLVLARYADQMPGQLSLVREDVPASSELPPAPQPTAPANELPEGALKPAAVPGTAGGKSSGTKSAAGAMASAKISKQAK